MPKIFLRTYFYGMLCISSLLLAACSPKPNTSNSKKYAIQVTDSQGDLVQLQQPAERIVCLFEASLDDLYMLGAGKNVIGIPAKIYTSPDLFKAYSILDHRILNKQLSTPSNWDTASSLESIMSLKPDLVVLYANQPDSADVLRKMNIPVYTVKSETLDETLKELKDLAQLTGKQKRGQQLSQFIQHEIQAMQVSNSQQTHKKTVYYAWSGGRIFSSSGRNSMPNTVMQLAGVENIVKTEIDQPNISPEMLIEWNPDVILLWNSNPTEVSQNPALATLKAVKTQHVFNLSPSFLYNPHTPKILLAANQLKHWVNHTDLAKYDQKRILSEFYGVKAAQQLLQLHTQ